MKFTKTIYGRLVSVQPFSDGYEIGIEEEDGTINFELMKRNELTIPLKIGQDIAIRTESSTMSNFLQFLTGIEHDGRTLYC